MGNWRLEGMRTVLALDAVRISTVLVARWRVRGEHGQSGLHTVDPLRMALLEMVVLGFAVRRASSKWRVASDGHECGGNCM